MWCAICLGDQDLCEKAWSTLQERPQFLAENIVNAFSSQKTKQRVLGEDADQTNMRLLAHYARRVLTDKNIAQYVKSL